MLLINDSQIKITVARLAEALKCSTRTIYRNMSNELKKEKELLNNQIKD
jgi:transcriptional antiterminator